MSGCFKSCGPRFDSWPEWPNLDVHTNGLLACLAHHHCQVRPNSLGAKCIVRLVVWKGPLLDQKEGSLLDQKPLLDQHMMFWRAGAYSCTTTTCGVKVHFVDVLCGGCVLWWIVKLEGTKWVMKLWISLIVKLELVWNWSRWLWNWSCLFECHLSLSCTNNFLADYSLIVKCVMKL